MECAPCMRYPIWEKPWIYYLILLYLYIFFAGYDEHMKDDIKEKETKCIEDIMKLRKKHIAAANMLFDIE